MIVFNGALPTPATTLEQCVSALFTEPFQRYRDGVRDLLQSRCVISFQSNRERMCSFCTFGEKCVKGIQSSGLTSGFCMKISKSGIKTLTLLQKWLIAKRNRVFWCGTGNLNKGKKMNTLHKKQTARNKDSIKYKTERNDSKHNN